MIVTGSKESSRLKTISLTPLLSYPGQLCIQTRFVTCDQSNALVKHLNSYFLATSDIEFVNVSRKHAKSQESTALKQSKCCSDLLNFAPKNPFVFSSLLLATHNGAKLSQVSELFLLEFWSTIRWHNGDPRAQVGFLQHQHRVTLSAL